MPNPVVHPDQVAEVLGDVLRPAVGKRVPFMVLYGRVQEALKAEHGAGVPMGVVKAVLRAAGAQVTRPSRSDRAQFVHDVVLVTLKAPPEQVEAPAPKPAPKRKDADLDARIHRALNSARRA
ncbi:hypothetical protein ACWEOP_26175 [Streptomyces chartreusis]